MLIYPAINQIANAFRRKPDLAAVIGSYDDVPGAPNFLSQYKPASPLCSPADKRRGVNLLGCCGAIRREIFLEMGGFDESIVNPRLKILSWAIGWKQAGYTIHVQDFAGQAFKALGCGLVAKS